MQILTIISETCSILGFVISLFIASQVIRITKSFNENEGKIQYGDGEKNIVKNHSMLVKENGMATYNVIDFTKSWIWDVIFFLIAYLFSARLRL